ncbi:MAG: methylphosphotriester-DNA--protein-cysteine methyltransferase family protein [Firmicutes bacterium]|nr:methylphosphotriester-DNA--protein-cysteine methyltransferase family protein [Bacillota bacterium]
MTPEQWTAILNCDPTFDGAFVYGVRTTGIFCRPSCRSRKSRRENVRIFASVEAALAEGYRPCKRCRPDSCRTPDEDVAQGAARLLRQGLHERWTLSRLAGMMHISPHHLHRVFKRVIGDSPAEFVRTLRLQEAARLLVHTDATVTDIAAALGFPTAAHFTTVFKKRYGMTPSAYREWRCSRPSKPHTEARISQEERLRRGLHLTATTTGERETAQAP